MKREGRADYDGSALRDDTANSKQAGAGILLFMLTDAGWHLGGGSSHRLPVDSAAYQAELTAPRLP